MRRRLRASLMSPLEWSKFAAGHVRQCSAMAAAWVPAGVSGPVQISWVGRPLRLEIGSNLPAAVVYVPKGGDSFCFEPVPHINNALNLPGHAPAMPIIAPGERFEAEIDFKVVSLNPGRPTSPAAELLPNPAAPA